MPRSRFQILALLVAALLSSMSFGQRQVSTAFVGPDLSGLRDASSQQPDNVGLHMRIVRRLLDDWRESNDPRGQRMLMDAVEKEFAELRRLQPDFTYPYRVIALQHYRRSEYDEFMAAVKEHQSVGPLDYDLRSYVVKVLLRQALDEENPAPEKKKEAAEYVGNWFDSGEAPAFGITLGACATWLVDPEFRDELMSIFRKRIENDPKNVNLAISYAACLWNLGRNESAWKVIHQAEKNGLADYQTGGRHPIVYLLQTKCPEERVATSYDGFEVEEFERLHAAHPHDAAIAYRLAKNYEVKGIAAREIYRLVERRIEALREKDPRADTATLEQQKTEWTARAKENFEKAVAPARRAIELNPTVETFSLLLGNVYARLERYDEAAKQLRDTIAKVPFFVQLRLRLAQILRDGGHLEESANELAVVCASLSSYPGTWVEKAGSLLEVPVEAHEKLLYDLIEDSKGRDFVIKAFEEAARNEPKNPNLKTHLAMIYYFVGNGPKAAEWMRAAEAEGICGEAGNEHPMATKIFGRKVW
ncbi:MAG: tetratricopeptide repeat protein [Planctomycetes bacterium]|nr:tetratricopeptide repeat protein [Planctomycetota bacterium]